MRRLPGFAIVALLLGTLPAGLGARAALSTPEADLNTGFKQPVRALVIAPDGRRLWAGGDDGEIIRVDLSGSKVVGRFRARGKVTALALSPDGKQLALGGWGKEVDLVAPETGKLLRRVGPLRGEPLGLAWSPKGDRLAVAGRDQHIALCDPRTGKVMRLLSGHTSWVGGVAFSPAGDRIAGAGWDHAVRVWNPATGKLLRSTFSHRYAINTVIFTGNGKGIISGADDQSILLQRAASGRTVKRLRLDTGLSLSLAPKRTLLATGTFRGKLVFIDTRAFRTRRIVRAHRAPIYAVGLTPDGRTAVTGGGDGRLRIWKTPR